MSTVQFTVPTGQHVTKLPHHQKWFSALEKQIQMDLVSLPGRGEPPPLDKIREVCAANPKYTRSTLIVTIRDGELTAEIPEARTNERGFSSIDTRIHTFVRMLRDLGKWCTQHSLTLPETSFAIYSSDTYAWEFNDLPWFVLAKPENKNGILIPDDSFVTHGPDGNQPLSQIGEEWAWDEALDMGKKIRGRGSGTIPHYFFKGSNTGASKWKTRELVAQYAETDPSFAVDLSGTREPWGLWSKYGALLDLPGNQPWSYRRKYLHLTGRPVVQVDIERYGSEYAQDGSGRWIQFFDKLLKPGQHYFSSIIEYTDGCKPVLPSMEDIKASALNARFPHTMSRFSGRKQLMKFTASHVKQYLYMALWHYKLYFA